MSDPLPPKGHHYGLSLLTAIVTGLLLPRFAIAMDTGKFIYWDNIAKLSSDWTISLLLAVLQLILKRAYQSHSSNISNKHIIYIIVRI